MMTETNSQPSNNAKLLEEAGTTLKQATSALYQASHHTDDGESERAEAATHRAMHYIEMANQTLAKLE